MTIWTIAEGLAGDATEADLVELVPLAVGAIPRVHEMWAVGEAGRAHEGRIALTEESTKDIEDAPERVRAAGERRGLKRLEQRARGNAHFHEVIEAIVEEDLWVEHHDHVDAREHLEHFLVQQEINRTDRLRVGAGEIKDALLAFAPHRAGNLVGAHAHAVVADVVFKVLFLLGHGAPDERSHGALVAFEHLLHC